MDFLKSVLRGELERLSSLLGEVLLGALQVLRMEGKKRQCASGRRSPFDQAGDNRSRKRESIDW